MLLKDFYLFFSFKARHYMRQIVIGIEYLHSHHILHRDLKLHNLLLTKENNVVHHLINKLFS